MRFVAALDTRIYGVPYLQGAEVDTATWSRKQLLTYLNNGTIQASALTAGSITDSLDVAGDGVTQSVDSEGKLVFTIDPSLSTLADVDMTGLENGDVPVWDQGDGLWRPGAGGGGGGGGASSGFDVFFTSTGADLGTGTVPTLYTAIPGMSLAIPGSAVPRTAIVDFSVMHTGSHTNRHIVHLDGVAVHEPILGVLAGGNTTYAAVGAGIPVLLSAGSSHTLDVSYQASDSTAAVTFTHRAITATVYDGATSPLGGTAGGPVGVSMSTDTQNDRRWYVPAGITSIDEFDDETISSAWERVDSTGSPLGGATWVEGAGGLSVRKTAVADTGSAVRALLRPIGTPMADGDAFITALTLFGNPATSYVMGGFCLSTTAAPGAGTQVISLQYTSANSVSTNDLRQCANFVVGASGSALTLPVIRLFSRIVKLPSGLWRLDCSPDGIQWLSSGTISNAFVPTHVGFINSNWGTATPGIVRYEFLRRQSGVI